MRHPFLSLRNEYLVLLTTMVVQNGAKAQIEEAARKLLDSDHRPLYEREEAATGVPAILLAALDERESGGNLRCAIGQGDPFDRVSTHVPRGKGPFASKVEADIFYIRYHGLDKTTQPWTWPYFCWKAEGWNGFGPRNHGIYTGYLWAGTNHYRRGKYVRDGVWDAGFVDRQLGVVPLAKRIIELAPALEFTPWPLLVGPAVAPAAPLTPPQGLASDVDVRWLQATLDRVFLPADRQLLVDGSFGRLTRSALKDFQSAHELAPDGLYGPQTAAAFAQLPIAGA